MRASFLAVGLGVLSACGPQSVLADGTYQSMESSGALAGASLAVDVKARTVSVTLAGASSAVVLQATPAAWGKGCPTNFSSVAVETWALAPDPAVLGSLSLAAPRLLAGCGLDTAKRDEVVLEGVSQPNDTQQHLVFRQLTP